MRVSVIFPRLSYLLFFFGIALLACDEVEQQDEAVEVGTQILAVQNGDQNTSSAFALLSRDSGAKYCSGTILQRLDGWTGILTARECVTGNGAADGTVVTPSRIQIKPEGLGWYTAAWIDAAPSVRDCAHNVAVTWISQEVGGPARFGICLGSGSTPSSYDFWGYGPDLIQRRAWGFSTTTWSCGSGWEDYCAFQSNNSGTSSLGSAKLVGGDQGGPGLVWPSASAPTIGGIAGGSLANSVCGAAAPGFGKFVQDAAYFYFVSSIANPSYNLDANGDPPANGGWVYGRHTGSGNRARIIWDPYTKEIKFWNTNLCWKPESGYVRIRTCTGANDQKWTVAHDSSCAITIQNVASSQCITDTGSWPSMGSCSGATGTKWFWHTQP
jgi:hypothetical protein